MFNLEDRIRSRIVRTFKNRGFDAAIGRIKWRGIRLTLDDLILDKADGSGQSVRIDKLTVGLSLWRSLIHLALEGGMIIEGIFLDLRVVSDKALVLQSIEAAFRIRKNGQLLQVKTGGVAAVLRHTRKKSQDDFSLQIPDTAWDDLIGVLDGHLLCPFIAGSRSESRISLMAFFRFAKGNALPLSWAEIKWDGLSLKSKIRFQKPSKVDPDYLIRILDEKLGIERNGQYVSFEQLPDNLVNAFISTEDPRYWAHSGVCLYGLGIALRENVRTRKFSRGASTITMQVARNLFLTHNRNLARKTEEAMMALLLENYYRIDKRTIFELYANLIEFAPGVYGVQNAARFYFDKELSALSLTDILVLTYIIPRPKHFYDALLAKTGQLQTNLRLHICNFASTMLGKEMISPAEYDSIDYTLRFAPSFGTLDLTKQA